MKKVLIQGEKYSKSQLFLMSKLEAECLPKARVILDAYEIAEWMEEYRSQYMPTDEEINKQVELFNFTDSIAEHMWKSGSLWCRNWFKSQIK